MNDQFSTSNGPNVEKEKFFTTPLMLIFVIVFIDLIGFGMVIPILPIYAHNEPFLASPWEIGWLVSIYSWMQFVFAPILGKLSDNYGRRPVLIVSLLVSAVGYVILGLANTILLIFIGRIISGITGGNISAAQAYIADTTTRENRGKGMALFGAAFGLGFVLGPAIGGILSKYGVHIPFFFAAVLSLVSGAASFFFLPESLKPKPEIPHAERPNRIAEIFNTLREAQFGTVTLNYFLLVTAFSIMTYAFVLYTAFEFGYTAEQNGYLFAFVGLMAVVGQGLLFGRLVERFGETRLTVVGCIMMAASLFAIPLVTPEYGGLAGLLGICAFLALGNSMASPSLTTVASKITHEHHQGAALGIMAGGASLARAIGPNIGGALLNNSVNNIDHFTIYRTFITASAIMFLAFLIALYSVRLIGTRVAVS